MLGVYMGYVNIYIYIYNRYVYEYLHDYNKINNFSFFHFIFMCMFFLQCGFRLSVLNNISSVCNNIRKLYFQFEEEQYPLS